LYLIIKLKTSTMALTDILNPVSLAASVLGNVVGGIQTAKLQKKQQALLDSEKQYDENTFNRNYYADQIKTSQNQAYLRELTNRLREQNIRAQKTSAITGATPEATAANAKVEAGAYGEAINKLSSGAEAKKERAQSLYGQQRTALMGAQNNLYQGQINNWRQFMSNASGLGTAGTAKPLASNTGAVGLGAGVPDAPDEMSQLQL
jgi:hypothetical protein